MYRSLLLLGLVVFTGFLTPAWTALAQPKLSITEFMASNSGSRTNSIRDEDGASSDWIEIFNPGTNPVSLRGWFLTDSETNLTEWAFPDATLLPNHYLVVFASQKDRTVVTGKLHTNFQLNKGGEYLALVDPATNVVSEFGPTYPPQQTDVSYGRDRTDPTLVGFFTVPTPGAPNVSGGAGFAPEVKFSENSGTFTNSFLVELSMSPLNTNAVIRFTLNGLTPTNLSSLYTNAILVTNTVQIRARTFETGLLPGPIHSEAYLKLSSKAVAASSDLPIVVLHQFSPGFPDSAPGVYAFMEIFEPKRGRSSMTNAPDLAVRTSLHDRGSSTGGQPKRNISMEVWDEANDDRKVPILGMPAESDWILYAPNNFEPVEIHNPFIYELSNEIGRYAVRTRLVEVYWNTAGGTFAPTATVSNYNGL